jgi:very-short-patch-repair endonuclease
VRQSPCLGTFDGRTHEQLIARFAELDRERIELARAEVALAHHRRLRRAEGTKDQLGMLRRELSKRTRHLPIRKLLAWAGGAVQAVKPVFMMSPLSVAEFLEPGALRFDLLLIDEASQIEPAHVLGAIARAEQMVVVGDDRQLSPTPLFQGTVAEEAGDGEDLQNGSGLQSILGLCAAQAMPQRTLGWHYRNRHPSLIALSNRELYDGRLHVAPSPLEDDPELGLTFHHVADGVYDRGGPGANAIEAEAVARAVIEHAGRRPDLSLGVGCFSVAQREAILGALERLRRATPDLEPFFEPDRPEPFFVKNVENLQGDERDVMFVSVGYGRDASGDLAMTFGPLATERGERRLNVLITRARRRLEVFSAITAEDIDLARAGRGVAAFKAFLHYAQTGVLEGAPPTGRAAASLFEEQVAAARAGLGHEVESQIGTAGFFVDLAIRDPERRGRYLLGIECDGAAWRGARWARDRDRLRQQVLEDRGWIVHRIWSADWYRQPERELGRVQAAIKEARATWAARDRLASEPSVPSDDIRQAIPGQPECTDEAIPTQPESADEAIPTQPPESADEARAIWAARDRATRPAAPEASSAARGASPAFPREPDVSGEVEAIGAPGAPYEEAEIVLPDGTEPDLLPLGAIVEAVHRVVQVEGPVHKDEVGRRIARACGRERTGRRIAGAVGDGLAEAVGRGLLTRDGSFYRLPGRDEPRVRDRSKVRSATLRRPEMIPPSEIRTAAMRVIIHAELDARPTDIVIRVGRMLGFHTASAQLRSAIEHEIDQLMGERHVVRKSEGMIQVRRASAA